MNDCPIARAGWQRVGLGIDADADGDLHFVIPELLAAFGWPNDALHRAKIYDIVDEVFDRAHSRRPITFPEESRKFNGGPSQ
jgi:hypothetical protein